MSFEDVIIWSEKVEDRYNCQVLKIGNFDGQLMVVDQINNVILVDMMVHVACDDSSKLNEDDTGLWKEICLDSIRFNNESRG